MRNVSDVFLIMWVESKKICITGIKIGKYGFNCVFNKKSAVLSVGVVFYYPSF